MMHSILFLGVILMFSVREGRQTQIDASSSVSPLKGQENDKKDVLYSKQAGYNGDSLIIGSPIDRIVDKQKSVTFKCSKLTDPSAYKEAYAMKVMKRPTRSYLWTSEEQSESVDIQDYFIHITKAVWTCRIDEQAPSFMRVVNELMNVKEIYEVKYYEGIEISLVNFGYEKSVKVTEIKYLVEEGSKIYSLKFLDSITLEENAEVQSNIPNLAERIMSSLPVTPFTKTKDVLFRAKGTAVRSTEISDNGKSIRIGSSWEKEYDVIDESIFECDKQLGIYPSLFKPECFQRHDVGKSHKIYAKITDQDFAELFIIVNREIWLCYNEVRRIPVFYRVLNDVIGKVPIRNLEYEDGVISLSSINIRGGKSVRYTEVNYFDLWSKKHLKQEVHFKVMGGRVNKLAYWRLDNGIPFKDIEYILSESMHVYETPNVYKTLINPEGYDLRVGSANSIFLSRDRKLECVKKDMIVSAYNTRVKIKMNEDNVFHSLELIRDDEARYLEYLSQEYWECMEPQLQDVIVRVSNKFRIIIPVHEIETFDGVEIKEILSESYKSVEVTEIKYLERRSGRVIKLDGEVDIASDPGKKAMFEATKASEMNVRKTVDEIVPYRNTPPRIRDPRDVDQDWFSHGYKKHTVASGQNVIKFNVIPQKVIDESQTSLVSCEFKSGYPEKLYPTFEIWNTGKGLSVIEALSDSGNTEIHSKYFENARNEVWECKSETNDLLFLRVLSNQCLKTPIPNDAGEIEYSGMDKILIETLKNSDQYTVKTRSIRYMDELNHEIINFKGLLFFEEKSRTGTWKSGTMQFPGVEENPRTRVSYDTQEMKYTLDRERKYNTRFLKKINVGDPQVLSIKNLVIGSKWVRSYGKKDTIIKCYLNENFVSWSEFVQIIAYYRTRIGLEGNQNINLFNEFVEKEHRVLIVWSCTDEKGDETIRRVFNRFNILSSELYRIKNYFYYDGVSVILTKSLRIQITEVKYLDLNKNILKIEGKAELQDGLNFESLTTDILAIRDIHYILNNVNEIYRTDVNSYGLVIEVGQKYEKTFDVEYTLKCFLQRKNVPKALIPKVVLLSDQNNNNPIMDKSTLSVYFEVTQKYWKCGDPGKTAFKLLRVVSTMKVKKQYAVAHIYHYDGVTVKDNGVIQEIKYLFDDGKNIVTKFGGFLNLSSENEITMEEVQSGSNLRKVNYFLDTKVLNFASQNQDGKHITLEVDSHWERMIENVNYAIVTCVKVENAGYLSKIGTEIFSFLEGGELYNQWQKMEELSNIVEYVDQEVWNCNMNEEMVFQKVVNKLILPDNLKLRRIYYPDGVSFGTLVLPRNNAALQITEVKFFDPKTGKFLKYVGKLKMMSRANDIVGKMFKMPAGFKEEPRELLDKVQVNELSKRIYWTLDTLRFFALRNGVEENSKEKVIYSQTRLHTLVVNTDGCRIFQVGTPWEEEFQTTAGELKCILDEWNRNYPYPHPARYIPRIVEFIDENVYELDEDEINRYFTVTKSNVWICTNELDKFIKVVSIIESKELDDIHSVRYPDGVRARVNLLHGKFSNVVLEETIYIDALTSKVLKYDKDLKTVKVGTEKPKTKNSNKLISSKEKRY